MGFEYEINRYGTKIYRIDGYKYGGYHRLDRPAIIYADGRKVWYVNGHFVHTKIHKWAKEMNIDLDNLTDEDKILIRIYWENYDGRK